MTSRVLLVEDHNVVREALRALLSSELGIEVVADAATGEAGIGLARSTHPDVIVVDLMLPDMTGFEVICEVLTVRPQPRIVVLSMYANEEYVLEALRCGALGYVLKQAFAGDLIKAVREVGAGQRYLSPPLSQPMLDEYASHRRVGEKLLKLSVREREVVRLVAAGKRNRETAELLGISRRTVEGHRASAMCKLGVNKEADLVRYALGGGLIPNDADSEDCFLTGGVNFVD